MTSAKDRSARTEPAAEWVSVASLTPWPDNPRKNDQAQHEPIFYGWRPGASHHWRGDRKQTTVLEFARPKRSAEHPTMKPVELVEYCIEQSSLRGELVADPFGGSGTTLIACERTGRRCFTIELDPRYCDVIVQRWEKLTGRKAERRGTQAA